METGQRNCSQAVQGILIGVIMAISDEVRRKFIESYKVNGIKIKTDTGWSSIDSVHKTVVYDVWHLITNRHELKCADTHIVFRQKSKLMEEVYVKDLNVGDIIYTKDGVDVVCNVVHTNDTDNMYDITLDDDNHRFYSNGILSHNSTTTRAYLLWHAIFHRDITIAILGNKLKLAREQLQELKFSYELLPYWMQPGVLQWNAESIRLSHNTKVMCAATSKDGIRGYAVNILYIDEFAFIRKEVAEPFITSIFPTIVSGNSTKIIVSSTPSGLNHFHDLWEKAEKGPQDEDWNGFVPKQIPWNAIPGRNEEWAKRQIKQMGLIAYNQEFCCKFIGSVATLIDVEFLDKLEIREPLKLPNVSDRYSIYDIPKSEAWLQAKGYEYAACIDSGYGLRQDSSVLKIYLVKSNTNLHLVAQLSANDLEIRLFSEKARKLLKKYYDPRLIIEMNGPGIACMDYFFYEAEYENLVNFDPKGRMRGLYAGNSIRDMAVILLKTYVQRKMIKDFDEDTIKELYSFGKTSKDKWGAMGGNHDDHVMCMMWVIFYVNSNLFYGNKDEKDVSTIEQDEIILDTPENRDIEAEAFRKLKDRDYQNSELAKYAEHNPYTDDDVVKPTENDEDYEPPMAMRS